MEKVEVIDIYNKEGYLIKKTANGVPIFIPKQDVPQVQIITPDTEWVMEKKLMSKEEFENRFPHLLATITKDNK